MKNSLLIAALLLGSFSSVVQAADRQVEPVSVELVSQLIVTDKQGKERRESAEASKPSDIIEYVATYTNHTDHKITDLKATLPVPYGLIFMPKTAKPRQVMASLDGQAFESVPLKRKVKQADGRMKSELVPYSEYRYLRWNLKELAAGKSKVVSARMQVTPLGSK